MFSKLLWSYGDIMRILYLLICFLLLGFILGYSLALKKSKEVQSSLQSFHLEQLENLQKSYSLLVKNFQSQADSLQHNNIVTSQIAYLPSGEKIVTKTINRSIIRETEKNRAIEKASHLDVNDSRLLVGESITEKKSSNSPVSLSHYKLSLIGFQGQNLTNVINLYENVQIYGGLRLFDLPIWIDVGTTPSHLLSSPTLLLGIEFQF